MPKMPYLYRSKFPSVHSLGGTFTTPGSFRLLILMRVLVLHIQVIKIQMRKVDLIIIGAQKAGTTSLKNYLSQHPEIVSHYQTEFTYFNDPEVYKKGYDSAFVNFIDKNDVPEGKKLIAKYAGLYAKTYALNALYEHNPDVKMVLILRNPVDRAYSAYNMEQTYNTDWMKTDFGGMIDIARKNDVNNPMYKLFIRMGLYANFVETIYSIFPKNQLKIVLFEDLKKNAIHVCRDVFKWIDVDADFVPDTSIIHNKTAKTKNPVVAKIIEMLRNNDNSLKQMAKTILPQDAYTKIGYLVLDMNKSKNKLIPPLKPEIRVQYDEFFRPDVKKLTELTGKDFSSWFNSKK